MSVAKSISFDSDIFIWLNEKFGKAPFSSQLNDILRSVMREERIYKIKLIKCPCGAEYSSKLANCPVCAEKEIKTIEDARQAEIRQKEAEKTEREQKIADLKEHIANLEVLSATHLNRFRNAEISRDDYINMVRPINDEIEADKKELKQLINGGNQDENKTG